MTLPGLTSLWINPGALMPPELNLKRAVFVLGKIDEILAWEKDRAREQDLRFVDLGRYLCEVRAGQYWRLEKMFHRSMISWRSVFRTHGERPIT